MPSMPPLPPAQAAAAGLTGAVSNKVAGDMPTAEPAFCKENAIQLSWASPRKAVSPGRPHHKLLLVRLTTPACMCCAPSLQPVLKPSHICLCLYMCDGCLGVCPAGLWAREPGQHMLHECSPAVPYAHTTAGRAVHAGGWAQHKCSRQAAPGPDRGHAGAYQEGTTCTQPSAAYVACQQSQGDQSQVCFSSQHTHGSPGYNIMGCMCRV